VAADSDVMIRPRDAVRKHFFRLSFLIVAERRSAFLLDCRVHGRPTWTTLAVEGGTTSIAFDIHLEDGGVVDQTIDRRCGVRANRPRCSRTRQLKHLWNQR
jgi:hypothetical protein